ncbi:hypothetical protein FOXB_16334 [Fusarium oxysporum f. sp. conglutinans Fo5176]|uniref:Uncharacterized protein n=1 Tax=Fusarium oxysporum (strain Fo5176) TaxID=660025 RepID=F9GCF1_FUSOF|nr:hypothetical protein FOXB_16334 [Fusarium oxysporum f. sp. conglutinans Fo5176]
MGLGRRGRKLGNQTTDGGPAPYCTGMNEV